MFPGLGLYGTDPAQRLNTAGYDLDDLDGDLSDLMCPVCVPCGWRLDDMARLLPPSYQSRLALVPRMMMQQ